MNIVDLLGILPYFMSLVLQLVTTEDSLVSAAVYLGTTNIVFPSIYHVLNIFGGLLAFADAK